MWSRISNPLLVEFSSGLKTHLAFEATQGHVEHYLRFRLFAVFKNAFFFFCISVGIHKTLLLRFLVVELFWRHLYEVKVSWSLNVLGGERKGAIIDPIRCPLRDIFVWKYHGVCAHLYVLYRNYFPLLELPQTLGLTLCFNGDRTRDFSTRRAELLLLSASKSTGSTSTASYPTV